MTLLSTFFNQKPETLAIAVAGKAHVRLRGFCDKDLQPAHWASPGLTVVAQINATKPARLIAYIRKQKKKRLVATLFGATLLAASCGIAGFILGVQYGTGPTALLEQVTTNGK